MKEEVKEESSGSSEGGGGLSPAQFKEMKESMLEAVREEMKKMKEEILEALGK